MPMTPLQARELLMLDGPRFHMEVDPAELDHPFWRFPGVRIQPRLDVRGKTPQQSITSIGPDMWLEIVRDHFNSNRLVYETIAPHLRNREWRKRHLWRG
jgi:hypothetical protein